MYIHVQFKKIYDCDNSNSFPNYVSPLQYYAIVIFK
jgi:hypothetical protein